MQHRTTHLINAQIGEIPAGGEVLAGAGLCLLAASRTPCVPGGEFLGLIDPGLSIRSQRPTLLVT